MTIPTFEDVMRPLLEYLARANGVVELSPLREGLVKDFPEMTREEFARRLSNNERLFFNRIRWAINDLKRAGFIHSPRRAHYEITKSGRVAINDWQVKIDRDYLKENSDEYREYIERSIRRSKQLRQPTETIEIKTEHIDNEKTPDEEIDAAVEKNNNALEVELLAQAREMSSKGFEQLIANLLAAMGYGTSCKAIDGVIKQDKLGIDKIYVQTRKYKKEESVQPKEIREFSGSLSEKVQRGIFFTTSSFTIEAQQAAEKAPRSIVLVDGEELARLMLDYDIGCRSRNFVLKHIEEEFFSEELLNE